MLHYGSDFRHLLQLKGAAVLLTVRQACPTLTHPTVPLRRSASKCQRQTFVTPHQQCYALSHTLLSPDCIVALKGHIDLLRANTEDHVKITRPVLGLGREASLREDVDGSGDQPTLQGKETSLKNVEVK